MSNNVNQILENIQARKPQPEGAKKAPQKFVATWNVFQTLAVDIKPETVSADAPAVTRERTIRLAIFASNHHVRRFRVQFVFPDNRPCQVDFDLVNSGDVMKGLIDEAQKVISAEVAKDLQKQSEFEARRSKSKPEEFKNSAPPGLSKLAKQDVPSLMNNPTLGKTAKKRAKEAARAEANRKAG